MGFAGIAKSIPRKILQTNPFGDLNDIKTHAYLSYFYLDEIFN